MASRKPRFTSDHDVLNELLSQAWTLSDAEIESLRPGNLSALIPLLDDPADAVHPFANPTRDQLDRPHVHLLRVMRDPAFFPFTCRTLFSKPDGSGPLEIAPFQGVILNELWARQFPMLVGSRGLGKSFNLALYILLRLTFCQGSKVVIVASAFRQAKVVFEYMEKIWYSSPVFRDLVMAQRVAGRDNGPRRDIDRCEFKIGDSVAIALPLGDGKKIRGLRANHVIAEEFDSILEEVYAVVIQGFGAVTADPIQNMKDHARQRVLKRLGLWSGEMDAEEAKRVRGNQSVLSGTAGYGFKHFAKFWREYKAILATRGDPKRLEDEVFKGPVPESFNWRDYSIIRVPYSLIPKGYMDEKTIARAKQTTHASHHLMEYGACFANDSEGFFRRSLVEHCVVNRPDDPNPPAWPSCGRVSFTAALRGKNNCKYVYGVDPASERDQFAVVITEVWPDHRRVVYCWTTSKSDHRLKLKKHMVNDHDFYRYAVRKLRDLFKVFPPERVLVDAGGGGISLREAFGDPDKLENGEAPIYEVVDPDDPKDTDDMTGEHILELVRFRDTAWVSEANHGMKKDLEDRALLFPMLDSAVLGLAELADEASQRVVENEDGEKVYATYDTLENAMLEIEDLKDELATIVLTQTPTGLEHWDTPDRKAAGSKPGRMRKDRYSALLMANMGARKLARALPTQAYEGGVGGFISELADAPAHARPSGGNLYRAPLWFQQGMAQAGGSYGAVVGRGVGTE